MLLNEIAENFLTSTLKINKSTPLELKDTRKTGEDGGMGWRIICRVLMVFYMRSSFIWVIRHIQVSSTSSSYVKEWLNITYFEHSNPNSQISHKVKREFLLYNCMSDQPDICLNLKHACEAIVLFFSPEKCYAFFLLKTWQHIFILWHTMSDVITIFLICMNSD